MSPHDNNVQENSMDIDRNIDNNNSRVILLRPELVQIRSTRAEVSFISYVLVPQKTLLQPELLFIIET
jgi:hypothetical protein